MTRRRLALLLAGAIAPLLVLATTWQVPLFVFRAGDCPLKVPSAWVQFDQDGDVEFDVKFQNIGNEEVQGLDIEIRAKGPNEEVLTTQRLSQHIKYGIAPGRKKNLSIDNVQKANWRTEKYEIEILRVWFDAERSWPAKKNGPEAKP